MNASMHWLQEKVLLAERALLYSFAFDFRTGDPYSFALKYNSTLKIMSAEDGEQALSWLGRAGIVTTLCLQYPSSTLAVVALWFAQHVTHGEVRRSCASTHHCSCRPGIAILVYTSQLSSLSIGSWCLTILANLALCYTFLSTRRV